MYYFLVEIQTTTKHHQFENARCTTHDTRHREERDLVFRESVAVSRESNYDARHTTQGRKEEGGKRRIGEVIGLLGYWVIGLFRSLNKRPP
jgi:hypothetical protein